MDFAIIGGDARMECLAEALRASGRDAVRLPAWGEGAGERIRAAVAGARCVVTPHPAEPGAASSLEEIAAVAPPSATVFLCGPRPLDAPPTGLRVVDLARDEALLCENARLTAEGAVSAAMARSRRCIRDLRCAVIGWGRVGGALAALLAAMGARVTVASRSEAHRLRAAAVGAQAVAPDALGEVLSESRLVFSTPPAPVLDRALLRCAHPEAMVIDLASPPYGVDLSAAWALGLRAWREPGLPGRYCPESAGLALMRAILRREGEANGHA